MVGLWAVGGGASSAPCIKMPQNIFEISGQDVYMYAQHSVSMSTIHQTAKIQA